LKKVFIAAIVMMVFLGSFAATANAYSTEALLSVAVNKKCVNCDLRGATFTEFSENIIDLSNSNMTKAYFSNTSLIKTNLTNVNLSKANLVSTDLTGANLTNAILTGANLTGAKGVTLKSLQGFNAKMDETTILPNGKPFGKGGQ